jgi:hypothetical protein
MARVRSPNYPALSLPEAISRVKIIHEAEQHLAAPKDVIAKHLGYNGLNGAALSTVSAIGKYGLIEEVAGGQMRVSPLAVTILYPPSSAEKAAAIKEAASKPALFVEIANQWEGHRPSDENLRSYLVRRNFAVDAIDRVIKAYRETMDLVTPESGVYPAQKQEDTVIQHRQPDPRIVSPVVPPGEVEPFRIVYTRNGIEVSGRLTDTESAEEFIATVEMLKQRLPSKSPAEKE